VGIAKIAIIGQNQWQNTSLFARKLRELKGKNGKIFQQELSNV